MINKANELLIKAFVKTKSFKEDFKADERGLQTVEVILILVISVALVAGIWTFLDGSLQGWWESIIKSGDVVTGDLYTPS